GGNMKIIPKFLLGSALALGAAGILATAPLAAGQDAAPATPPPFAHRARMMGFLGSAPLITIALNHKSDLALSDEQVANLEKIKSHYQSQVKAKIQEGEKYRSELRYQRLEALENGRSVLSAEQQEQLKSLLRARHGN